MDNSEAHNTVKFLRLVKENAAEAMKICLEKEKPEKFPKLQCYFGKQETGEKILLTVDFKAEKLG